MTGFECFATFVIHRAKHTSKGVARHWRQELVSELYKFDEFTNRSVRLNSFFFITKIINLLEIANKIR